MSSPRADSALTNGEKIRDLRLGKGWTRKELSEKSGVSSSTLGRAEKGCRVRATILAEVAEALAVLPAEIMRSEETSGRMRSTGLPASSFPESLRRWVCSFDAFIADRTHGFTGRDFVFEALNRFLANRKCPSGYFVIRGAPGIGKSALIAQLVQTRHCDVHHFNIALQAIHTPQQFLGNICARLIKRFGLAYNRLPHDFDKDGKLLNQLLSEASAQLPRGDKLIIPIDALDEVEHDPDHRPSNPLYLPPDLPKNVYVVVTTRPTHRSSLQVTHARTLTLTAGSTENLRDIRAYITSYFSDRGVRGWVKKRGLTEAEFTKLLQTKSEGNFMYLHHVLPAIADGRLEADGFAELPDGLMAYYRGHWTQMRRNDTEGFDRLYRPVVCVLAAVKQAVPAAQIAEWTKLELHLVRRVLDEWREFLYVERGPERRRQYRIYHTTFREFMEEEVDPGLREFHEMIARSCLVKIGRLK